MIKEVLSLLLKNMNPGVTAEVWISTCETDVVLWIICVVSWSSKFRNWGEDTCVEEVRVCFVESCLALPVNSFQGICQCLMLTNQWLRERHAWKCLFLLNLQRRKRQLKNKKKWIENEQLWPWADSSANYTAISYPLYVDKYGSISHMAYKSVWESLVTTQST